MIKFVNKIFSRDPTTSFHSEQYLRHSARRLEHLASLSIPVEGKSVLELGSGIGDHTSYFLDRGCDVTSTDSRSSNLVILKTRFPNHKTMTLDVDQPISTLNLKFDIVYAYGILYHLSNPVEAIQRIANWTGGILLLETCVSPFVHGPNVVTEDKLNPTQAHAGIGCRPGRRWLFELLQTQFENVYTTITQPRHPEFPLDWSIASESQLTRAIFVCSRESLDLPSLTRDLTSSQLPQT